jgi:hypothetical protein
MLLKELPNIFIGADNSIRRQVQEHYKLVYFYGWRLVFVFALYLVKSSIFVLLAVIFSVLSDKNLKLLATLCRIKNIRSVYG